MKVSFSKLENNFDVANICNLYYGLYKIHKHTGYGNKAKPVGFKFSTLQRFPKESESLGSECF